VDIPIFTGISNSERHPGFVACKAERRGGNGATVAIWIVFVTVMTAFIGTNFAFTAGFVWDGVTFTAYEKFSSNRFFANGAREGDAAVTNRVGCRI
jgi:hypothetical protein